jgi:AAA+ superfamily predicted ATPase
MYLDKDPQLALVDLLAKIEIGIKQGVKDLILEIDPSPFRDNLLYLLRLEKRPDAILDTRVMVEDEAGSLNLDWRQSQLPLSSLTLTPPDISLNGTAFDIILPSLKLDDIVLDGPTRRDAVRIMLESRDSDQLRSAGLAPASCVLFCGPSGSGKSTSAEAIAYDLGLKLVRFSFSNITSILAEGNAETINRIIEYIGIGRWVIFVDGVEPQPDTEDDPSLVDFRKRLETLFPLFDNMFGRSLIIFSSTSEEVLHTSVWQRFDEVIRFHPPGKAEIRQTLVKWLNPLEYTEEQLEKLLEMADDLSFSTVERLCLDVKRSCVLRGDSIIQDADLAGAADRQRSRTRSFNFSSVRLVGQAERPTPLYATIDR